MPLLSTSTSPPPLRNQVWDSTELQVTVKGRERTEDSLKANLSSADCLDNLFFDDIPLN